MSMEKNEENVPARHKKIGTKLLRNRFQIIIRRGPDTALSILYLDSSVIDQDQLGSFQNW